MNKAYMMNELKAVYENGGNIIDYMHGNREAKNLIEEILISYDFQAGSYYDEYKKGKDVFYQYHNQLAQILDQFIQESCSIMEAGVGEARSLVPIVNRLDKKKIEKVYGFDLSWSRIKYAEKFEKDYKETNCPKIQFWVGDIMNMAVKDSAVDVVFTVGACEPNGGKEKELLQELYRVTRRYLVLFEPAYELADEEAKKRMIKYGYVTKLYETAISMNYKIIKHELLDISLNPLNPMGVIVIEKDVKGRNPKESIFCDPVSKSGLDKCMDAWFCKESLLAYPIIGGIPLLMAEYAVVATKYNLFHEHNIS